MKRIMIIGSLLIVSCLGWTQDQAPLTVFYYNLNVDMEFQAALRDIDEYSEDLGEFLRGKNPLKEGIIDETYDKLALRIKNDTRFEFLPIETLQATDGKDIFYSARGYPMGNKKRALTHGTSPYYGFIHIDVMARSGSLSSSRSGLRQSEKKKFKPRVHITMKVFDERGKRVGNYNVNATSEEEVVIQTEMLLDWFKVGEDRRLEDGDNQHIIAELIDEALARLIDEMTAGSKV